MAVFGNLADLPFAEVISMVDNRIGKLELWNLPCSDRYELFVLNGHLRKLNVNGQEIIDPANIREHFIVLLNLKQGEFEFVKSDLHQINTTVRIPLQQVLLSLNATYQTNSDSQHYADPRTRFEAVKMPDHFKDSALNKFWQDSHLNLISGTCAEELAQLQNIKLEQVLFHMYQLRIAGFIAPMRGVLPSTASTRLTPVTTSATASFGNSYRGSSLITDAPSTFTIHAAFDAPMVQINTEYFKTEPKVPVIPVRKPSLIERLLAALKEKKL